MTRLVNGVLLLTVRSANAVGRTSRTSAWRKKGGPGGRPRSLARRCVGLLLIPLLHHLGNAAPVIDRFDDPTLPPFAYLGEGAVAPAANRTSVPPEAAASVGLYDTEGRSGIVRYGGDSRLSGSLGFSDGSIYTVEGYSSPRVEVFSPGIPFWWESRNPWNGTVRGWAKSSYYYNYPAYVLPVPGSEVGFSIHREANFSGRMSMGIFVSLVDKLNTPSPLIRNYMSHSGRTSVFTAVYLPGNTLSESVGIESHEYDSNDLAAYFPGLFWGNYAGVPLDSSSSPFATALPLGPLLIAATFDGSTTGMIEVEGLDHTYYQAELPFAPLPGSSLPTTREVLALGEPPAFVLGPSLDAVMLRDSVDLTTDLDYHCDRNHDGVLDAADYLLYNRAEEQ